MFKKCLLDKNLDGLSMMLNEFTYFVGTWPRLRTGAVELVNHNGVAHISHLYVLKLNVCCNSCATLCHQKKNLSISPTLVSADKHVNFKIHKF